MYKKQQVIDCLYGLVGWRQTENPDFPTLAPNLLESRSGIYFNEEHPLMNIEYLDQAFKNYSKYLYPTYLPAQIYTSGVRVEFSGMVYESRINNNQANQPDTSPNQWLVVNELSQKLEWLVRSSIDDLVRKIFVEKKLNKVTKSMLESVQIFDGPGSLFDKTINQGNFVGIVIKPHSHTNLSVILDSIGLQFDTANPNFKLYLFHSSQNIPIRVYDFNYQNNNRFEWFSAEKQELKHFDTRYDAGGYYILGYYQDDILGQAINKDYSFDHPPHCSSCNGNHRLYESWSRFVSYESVSVRAPDIAGISPADTGGNPTLFDIDKISSHSADNWGLNLDITVKCDVSDFFCKQADLLIDGIAKEVTLKCLKKLSHSIRNNVIAKEVADRALYELNIKENPSGFLSDYKRTLKSIEFDFSDLNEACLPCNERWGMSSAKV